MATNKARLTLTLEPELAAVIDRLARVQQHPKARVVTEILNETVPILEKVAMTCELAMRAQKGAKEGITRALNEAEAEMAPMMAAVVSAYDGLGRQLGDIAERLDAGGAGQGTGRAADGALGGAAGGGRRRRKDPRPVNTGVTDTKREAEQQPEPAPGAGLGRAG